MGNLGRVLPFDLDHLFCPVDNIEIALAVSIPNVSRPQEPVRRERALGEGCIADVASHDVGSSEDELAYFGICMSRCVSE